MNSSRPIYLDYNATTPVDPRVLEAMLPFFTENFGNPASSLHSYGWTAAQAVEQARKSVAQLLGCKASEIYFTSGATESNNWSLIGLLRQHQLHGKKDFHFITSNAEHNSVLQCIPQLEREGAQVEILPVNRYGQVEPEQIEKAIRPNTLLMSFIWGNNEVGAINPMDKISKLAQEKQVLFHSDATQAVGKIPVELDKLHIDLLSFSAHKLYGPKGVGGLYIRSSQPKVSLLPLICGGGQEKGLRSGTLNVPGIVGLGKACALAQQEMQPNSEHALALSADFLKLIQTEFAEVVLNGHPQQRLPGHLSLTFPDIDMGLLVLRMNELALSMSSACTSGAAHPSHVLKAIGLSAPQAASTLRISFGRPSTSQEAEAAARILLNHIKKVKNSQDLDPLDEATSSVIS